MTSRSVSVAVLGLMNNDFPSPSIAVAQALKGQPGVTEVIGWATDPYETGSYFPGLFDAVYRLPDPSSWEIFLHRARFLQSQRPIQVLIPGNHYLTANLAPLASELQRSGIYTFLPPEALLEKTLPAAFIALAKQAGCDTGSVVVATDRTQLEDRIPSLTDFPLEALTAKGEYYRLLSILDAMALKPRLERQVPIIFRPVEKDGVEIAAVTDRDSRVVSWAAVAKGAVVKDGTPWFGISFVDEELLHLIQRLLTTIGWIGSATIGCERQGDAYALRYMKPHLPGWSAIFPQCVANPALALVRLALNESTARETPAAGIFFSHASYEIASTIEDFARFQDTGELIKTDKEHDDGI